MMGPHHAASGAAAWVLLAADYAVPLGSLAGVGLLGSGSALALPEEIPLGFGLLGGVTDLGVLTGAIVAAGAALLPDADHRHASIAHALPPVSEWICRAVGTLAGGHRNGTHSLLGLAAFTVLAWLLSLLAMPTTTGTVQLGAGLGTVLLASFATKALKFIPDRARRAPWLVAVPLGALVAVGLGDQGQLFVAAVALGTAVHVAGDMLTGGGCNLLWPATLKPLRLFTCIPVVKELWSSGGRMRVPLLGSTGSRRERVLAVPISLLAMAGIIAALVGVVTG